MPALLVQVPMWLIASPQKMNRKIVENASCIVNTNAASWVVAERILDEDCNNLHSSHNI
jgi:hypothetical protein